MSAKKCKHEHMVLGTHPDFRKGWLCLDCRKQILDVNLRGYVVVFAAFKEAQ